MINLTGISLNPLNQVNANEQIRITAIATGSEVHNGICGTITTDDQGAYEATLLEGKYAIESLQSGSREWHLLGNVDVSSSAAQTMTIIELVTDYPYIP